MSNSANFSAIETGLGVMAQQSPMRVETTEGWLEKSILAPSGATTDCTAYDDDRSPVTRMCTMKPCPPDVQ